MHSIAMENCDTSVDSEEYLQPKSHLPGCSNIIGIPISDSPLPQNAHDLEVLRFTMNRMPGRICAMKGT